MPKNAATARAVLVISVFMGLRRGRGLSLILCRSASGIALSMCLVVMSVGVFRVLPPHTYIVAAFEQPKGC